MSRLTANIRLGMGYSADLSASASSLARSFARSTGSWRAIAGQNIIVANGPT